MSSVIKIDLSQFNTPLEQLIKEKKPIFYQYTIEQIKEILLTSKTYKEASQKIGYKGCNGVISQNIDNIAKEIGINLPFTRKKSTNRIELEGQTFGELTVFKKDVERSKKEQRSYWFVKCSCGVIKQESVLASNLKSGKIRSCGHLKNNHFKGPSKGELKIENFLKENNITYSKEYQIQIFDYFKNKNIKLWFDFAIYDQNQIKCFIEFNGEQHYMPIKYFGGESKFNSQQYNDNLKKQYCLNNNIQLIIIPYNKIEDIQIILKGVL